MDKDKSKYKYLVKNDFISEENFNAAFFQAENNNEDIEKILTKNFAVSEDAVADALREYCGIPNINKKYLTSFDLDEKIFFRAKTDFMRDKLWTPVISDKKSVIIAVNDFNLSDIDEIKEIFYEYEATFCSALKKEILGFIDAFQKTVSANKKEAAADSDDISIVNMVNEVITNAYKKRASDIHIEPYSDKKGMNIRIRIDGTCRLYKKIDSLYKDAFISRLKIMADLDIAERRKPQDGKIRFKNFGNEDIELRIVTIPTQGNNEDITLRILPSGKPPLLEHMGFSKENYENFVKAIEKPHGIIIVCGPTGSGKTFTLHSALRRLNKPDVKIWTAEDPIEITQDGLRQVQINSKIGFDFTSAMKAFLRADPDIIMLGEMRDKETAKIGIRASLTGHLIFSTLHTNSAPESIARLLDMGMDSFNFADAIICVLAQRLVLTLCNDCKKAYTPSENEYLNLVREFGKEQFMKRVGIPYSDKLILYKPTGCHQCDNTGYKGRIPIHELLTGTEEIKRLIQQNAGTDKIKEQAVKDGMLTLKQDGIQKVFKGLCNFTEILKICG